MPDTAIAGQADNAVPETSARAFFQDVETVPGNHTEMCKPADLADSAFQTLRARVLESAPGPFLLGTKAVQQANARAIASARQVIFTIGSRSRDERYLRSIEDRLRADSALIYYRVLMGRPRRRALWEHIERVLGFRDVADRSTGQRTLYVGLYDRPDEQAEINLMGTETTCTVILPPAEGVGTYSTAMCFRDGAHVDSYRKLAHELMGRGSDIRSLDDLRRLVPDPPSK